MLWLRDWLNERVSYSVSEVLAWVTALIKFLESVFIKFYFLSILIDLYDLEILHRQKYFTFKGFVTIDDSLEFNACWFAIWDACQFVAYDCFKRFESFNYLAWFYQLHYYFLNAQTNDFCVVLFWLYLLFLHVSLDLSWDCICYWVFAFIFSQWSNSCSVYFLLVRFTYFQIA